MIWIRLYNLTSTLNFPPRFSDPVGVMMVAVHMVSEMVCNDGEAIIGKYLLSNFFLTIAYLSRDDLNFFTVFWLDYINEGTNNQEFVNTAKNAGERTG